jgi:hypothetical protein
MTSTERFFDGKLNKDDRDNLSVGGEEEEYSDTESIQSLPELCDLEEVVCARYMLPKDIPKPEMLVCLHLTEFNEMCMELEDKIEAINDPISRFEKKMKKIENYERSREGEQTSSSSSSSRAAKRKKTKNNKNKNKLLSTPPTPLTQKERDNQERLLKELSLLLQKKSRIESYYSHILLKTIKSHPNPTKALLSIQKLLEHDKATIHSLTMHLDHFAYIDSGLDDGDTGDDESGSSFSSSSSF